MSAADVLAALFALASEEKAVVYRRFFRTEPGQYGEGDRFLGVTVPQVRAVEKLFRRELTLGDVQALLAHDFHEARQCALIHLVARYSKADPAGKETIFQLYLGSTDRINNWDLVDVSAPGIVGAHLHGKDPSRLFALASSPLLWDRRIAVIATQFFIRKGHLDTTYALCGRLLGDRQDLIHKACGWMLREAGRKDENRLRAFLDAHAAAMPRVELRYALEKQPPEVRAHYLGLR
ncbi:DNA alkylation repair protein [Myxococcota bacterium]|nr:DNA alkylation repair protein [Myxococcota bacterium]MBU1411703.1 DNA alkylation repair protein [Myxococcota bacterium]MBU1512104.1 DNA alkylation repair protein [Myxococcota bacterium]